MYCHLIALLSGSTLQMVKQLVKDINLCMISLFYVFRNEYGYRTNSNLRE